MKKLLPALSLLLFATNLFAQAIITFSPGSSFFIGAGTTVAFDSLVLVPSTNLTITGANALSKNTALSHASSNASIHRVFNFANTVGAFNGTVIFYYADAALNGISEGALTLNVHDGTQWRSYGSSVTRDATNNSVTTTGLLNVNLNEITLASNLSPLPVGFTELQAMCNNGSPQLLWKIAFANNLSHFDIETSTDGRSWQQNGSVLAQAGTSFRFSPPVSTASLYRIVAVQSDGQRFISNVLKSACNASDRLLLYPNPASTNLTISITSAQTNTATLTVLDASGQSVRQLFKSLVKGTNVFTLNVGNLPGGNYTITVLQNGESQGVQFVKQ